MRELRVITFDHEATDQVVVESVLGEDTEFEIVGHGADGLAAVSAIQSLRPDLAILSLQLPGVSGFDVIESIAPNDRPAVIFFADTLQEAARAFEVGAVDYLLRPLGVVRFCAALERAKRWIRQGDMDDLEMRLWRLLERALAAGGSRPISSAWPARISFKVEGDYHIVGVRDIIWVEAQRDLVKVCVAGKVQLVRESLQEFEKRLDPARFSRIHRSFIANLEHVVKISAGRGGESTLWMTDGTKIPASRSSRPSLAVLTGREPDQALAFARAFELKQKDDRPSPSS